MTRWVRRLTPWALALVVGLIVLGQGTLNRPVVEPLTVAQVPTAPAACPPPETAARLVALSEYAAALTGSLALVDADERPEVALGVSDGLRHILEHEAQGTALAVVLTDLADALERYAGGNPLALAGIQAASARNAQLRAHYRFCSQQSPHTSAVMPAVIPAKAGKAGTHKALWMPACAGMTL